MAINAHHRISLTFHLQPLPGPHDLRGWVSVDPPLEDGVAALREAGVSEDLLEDGRGGRAAAAAHVRGGSVA